MSTDVTCTEFAHMIADEIEDHIGFMPEVRVVIRSAAEDLEASGVGGQHAKWFWHTVAGALMMRRPESDRQLADLFTAAAEEALAQVASYGSII